METIFFGVLAAAAMGWLGLVAACLALLRKGRSGDKGLAPTSSEPAPSPLGSTPLEAQPPIVFLADDTDEDHETRFYCPDPTEHLTPEALQAMMLGVEPPPQSEGPVEPDATTRPSEYPSGVDDLSIRGERVEAGLNPRALLDGGGPVAAFSRRIQSIRTSVH